MTFVNDLLTWLTDLAAGAALWQQIGVLVLAGAIPFIESYLGSFIGVLAGVTPVVAVASAVAGNVISTFAVIAAASRARVAVTQGRAPDPQRETPARTEKVAKSLERFGVPGVCLLGPLVVASQLTAPALIALGAGKRTVMAWQAIAIVLWGVLFGFFGDVVASLV